MRATVDFDLARADAEGLGIRVERWTTPREDEHGRLRCEVGRYLDDGTFYVIVFGGQSEEMATSALEVAVRRLADFDQQHWFVRFPSGEPQPADICCRPLAFVMLGDCKGLPMELMADVRQLLAPAS